MTCLVTDILLHQLVIFAHLLRHCLREGLLNLFRTQRGIQYKTNVQGSESH